MNLRIVKTPEFLKWIFPRRTWVFSNPKDKVFLTFDDGPIPEVTPWVLDRLKEYNAKATFFCIGENIQKHPEIFRRILAEGHAIGNHSYNHLNGWQTKTSDYIENVLACEEAIQSESLSANTERLPSTKIFRPPYGKMTSRQAKILQKKGFKIIMWTVLSYDYDKEVSKEECLQNVYNNLNPGNIIVFHDSLKAEKNLRHALPKVLEYIEKDKSLSFGKIEF